MSVFHIWIVFDQLYNLIQAELQLSASPCILILLSLSPSQINFRCKPTFREGGSRCLRDVSPPHRHTTLNHAECVVYSLYSICSYTHCSPMAEWTLVGTFTCDPLCLFATAERFETSLGPSPATRGEVSSVRESTSRLHWRTHMQHSSMFMLSYTFIAEFPAEVLPQQGDRGHQLLLVQAGSECHVSV